MTPVKNKAGKFFSKKIDIKKVSFFSKIGPTSSKLIYAAIAINLLTIIVIVLFRNSLPPEVPLFFGLPKGEDQLTSPLGLVMPSAVSFVILAINTTLAIFLKESFLKQTLIIAAVVLSIFSAITTFKIILLVGNI